MAAQLGEIESWDEVRFAYHVARLGTVSAAAAYLDVHHATVIRHIDALEVRLGAKLFQRHPRGYTPTEAGRDLFKVAETAEDLLAQFSGRVKGCGAAVTGELVVTTVTSVSSLLAPVFLDFSKLHPDIRFRVIAESRRLRLEYGEAHVAVRAGTAPQEPDNIARRLGEMPIGLYGHDTYLQRVGTPQTEAELIDFDFVGPDNPDSRVEHDKWLAANIPEARVVFRSNEPHGQVDAVRAGFGLGFVPQPMVRPGDGLVEILPPRDDWNAKLWLVTHVDLHRTAKVQAFTDFLKRRAVTWCAT